MSANPSPPQSEPLDDETERILQYVAYDTPSGEGPYRGSIHLVGAIRNRIRELVEEARLSVRHEAAVAQARRMTPPEERLCDECGGCGWNAIGHTTVQRACTKCRGTGILPRPHEVPPHMPGNPIYGR